MDDPPVLVVRMDGRAGSVHRAGRAARAFLDALPAAYEGEMDERVAEDVVLIVTELTSNACRHAPGPCTLRVTVEPPYVDVAVADSDPPGAFPQAAPGPAGYGLRIVSRLSEGVEVRPAPGGKVVRAALRVGPAGASG
ncbi:ATP-binding protein [Streptomyces sp. PTM05]|uniref:ATP-binding protein n=1 Tax=Streptantibioticus parmotrematis TaxID=2873249 RepID=A0ABS7QJT7_9ACTN|nr:ATP-binding protein [Streptantibioticus parmotrematis]MBY8883451.1 ATP-binding protein [Streptantibioticus parmotrematis]